MSLEKEICKHEQVEYLGTQEGFEELPSIELANCIRCKSTIQLTQEYTHKGKNYYGASYYTKKSKDINAEGEFFDQITLYWIAQLNTALVAILVVKDKHWLSLPFIIMIGGFAAWHQNKIKKYHNKN